MAGPAASKEGGPQTGGAAPSRLSPQADRRGRCAIALMAKEPRAGAADLALFAYAIGYRTQDGVASHGAEGRSDGLGRNRHQLASDHVALGPEGLLDQNATLCSWSYQPLMRGQTAPTAPVPPST